MFLDMSKSSSLTAARRVLRKARREVRRCGPAAVAVLLLAGLTATLLAGAVPL